MLRKQARIRSHRIGHCLKCDLGPDHEKQRNHRFKHRARPRSFTGHWCKSFPCLFVLELTFPRIRKMPTYQDGTLSSHDGSSTLRVYKDLVVTP